MVTPDSVEREFTLLTAAARYDQLRTRDALASAASELIDDEAAPGVPLGKEEALELLALAEVIARKASYGRQLTIRSARAAGASWSQIGAALGTSKQAAWEAHTRWIEEQAEQRRRSEDVDEHWEAAARELAGRPDDDPPRSGP